MNMTDLKTLFYKRFSSVNKYLGAISTGLPISLLGYIHTDRISTISTCVSPDIKMLASKTEDFYITFTSTRTDKRRRYSILNPTGDDKISRFIAELKPENGGEILVDSSIPPSFDQNIPYTAAAIMSVINLQTKKQKPFELLDFLKDGHNAYQTVFNHKHGYATHIFGTGINPLPLPLSMHKILVIDTLNKSARLNNIGALFFKIQKIYPNIGSFSDLTEDMVNKLQLSDRDRLLSLHLIYENKLIYEGAKALKAVNLSDFSQIVNRSFLSQKKILPKSDSRVFVCDTLLKTAGVLCARVDNCGALAIVKDEYCNFAANQIRTVFLGRFGFSPVICVTDTHAL